MRRLRDGRRLAPSLLQIDPGLGEEVADGGDVVGAVEQPVGVAPGVDGQLVGEALAGSDPERISASPLRLMRALPLFRHQTSRPV